MWLKPRLDRRAVTVTVKGMASMRSIGLATKKLCKTSLVPFRPATHGVVWTVLVGSAAITLVATSLMLTPMQASAGAVVDSVPIRPRCLSSLVPLNRSWGEERNADINQEFNDYAAIYLDAASVDCKDVAVSRLDKKLEGILRFADAGERVKTAAGFEVHPFHNWLWGAAITHLYAASLELRHSGLAPREDLLERTREIFETIP